MEAYWAFLGERKHDGRERKDIKSAWTRYFLFFFFLKLAMGEIEGKNSFLVFSVCNLVFFFAFPPMKAACPFLFFSFCQTKVVTYDDGYERASRRILLLIPPFSVT